MKYSIRLTLALAFVGVAAMAAVALGEHATPVADGHAPNLDRRARIERRMDGHHRFGHALRHRMVTGEFKVQTKDGFATVRVDQGTVTAVGDDSLTLKRADGQSVTVPVTAGTHIGRDGDQAHLSDIKVGDRVRTIRADAGEGFTTKRVMAHSPDAEPKDGAAVEQTDFSI